MNRFLRTMVFLAFCGAVLTGPMVLAQTDGGAVPPPAPPVAGTPALTAITQADVEAFLKEVDRSADERKVEILEPLMADDLKIIVNNMPTPQGPQKVEMGKTDYLANTKQVFEAMESYEHSRKDQEIQILENGKAAMVKATAYEKVVIQGKPLETTSRETSTLELREGKILVTLIESEVLDLKQ